MVFVDIQFPAGIAFGVQSDTEWKTTLVAVKSGFESTNQEWSNARQVFDVGMVVRPATEYLLIKAHFNQVRARARSFPLLDPIDFEVTQAAGRLTFISGTSWQMYYRYGSGSDAYDRKITRPKTGTINVFRTRSAVTTNANADATVSYTTGVVLIANHVALDTYAWSGEFFVPCRYDVDKLPAVAVDRQPGSEGELLVECQSIPIVEVKE